MAVTTHTTLHFVSGHTLDVVETIAQIWSAAPQNLVFPAGATIVACACNLTNGSGATVSVCMARVEWMEPK